MNYNLLSSRCSFISIALIQDYTSFLDTHLLLPQHTNIILIFIVALFSSNIFSRIFYGAIKSYRASGIAVNSSLFVLLPLKCLVTFLTNATQWLNGHIFIYNY